MKLLVFEIGPDEPRSAVPVIDARYSTAVWQPGWTAVRPPGGAWWPFGVWWALDRLRLFGTRDYGVYLVRDGDQVAHRSCIFPGHWRFPFMASADIQVGDTWTAEAHRGRALAHHALADVARRFADRRVWYVCEPHNTASIRVVEKAGFRRTGTSTKTAPLGLGLFGVYVKDAER
jgi:RimJ/RimL family protein N-acetyltransferase